MFETHCEIEVQAPAEVAFAVIWDVGRYPDFLTDVVDVEVHPSEDPWVQEATYFVPFIRTRCYRVRLEGQPPRQMDWHLVSGENLRVNEGTWVVRALDGRSCHVHYTVRLEFEISMPEAIMRRLAEFNLPTMLRQVKARAESKAREVVGG